MKNLLVLLLCLTCLAVHAEDSSKADIEAETRLQLEGATRNYLATFRRVQRLMYPLLRAAAPNCLGLRHRSLGNLPIDLDTFPPQFRETAQRIYGLGPTRPLKFVNVAPGTPAYEAGLRDDDELLRVANVGLERGSGRLLRMQAAIATNSPDGEPVAVEVLRKQVLVKVEVRSEWVCTYGIGVTVAEVVNAQNAFNSLTVFTGISKFLPADNELAVVLGHEMGHFLLRHSQAAIVKIANVAKGEGAAFLQHSVDRENDADFVGLMLVAQAGYDVSRAQKIWRRVGSSNAAGISAGANATHPASPERFVRIKSAVEEVARRRAQGEPLTVFQYAMPTYSADDATAAFRTMLGAVKMPDKPAAFVENQVAGVPAAVLQGVSLPEVAAERLNRWDLIPALSIDGRVAYQQFVLDQRRPRAFAMNGAGQWASAYGDGAADQAIARCAAPGCQIYAQDDAVVMSESVLADMRRKLAAAAAALADGGRIKTHSRIVPPDSGFAAASDVDAVPVLPRFREKYAEYLTKPGPKAFAINASGGYRYYFDSPEAMERVLTQCDIQGDTCWLYAVDGHVIWEREPARRIRQVNQLALPATH
ncbi:M48 family metalloprotease [Uliginosibacterium sp. H3]|uniref:M48 family metalloprotease n=1 Tax=Uliginosibacterium silvisoli TaxID=3114758 RepID=A0ABU6K0D8_9RHOO|nr:M48 family metalloprotease [Uliginosibacterium sp. H3]